MPESRVKKTLLNVRINLICYFAALVVSFFTRKVFLDELGKEFIGLTTTIGSLLGFLNLAELGVGASIAYFLYKPLFQDDRKKVCELISIMGYLYRTIGLVILAVGIVFSLFLPLIFKNAPFPRAVVFYCFYASLFASLIGYFVNYRANTIFGADQRQYLVTGYFQATQLAQVLIQAFLVVRFHNYVLYISIALFFSLTNSVILNWKYSHVYPWVTSSISEGRVAIRQHPEILQYVKRVFIHQIGGFVCSSVMPTIIYGFSSLGLVALYSNYTLLTSKVSALVGNMMGGSNASVGNLIAEGNSENTYKCYKEMFSIKFLIVSIFTVLLYKFSTPFISVWLGKDYAINAILVALICGEFGLNLMRGTTEEFLNGYGLKADIWIPICRVCTLGVMLLTGYLWGLAGILAVPLAFQLLVLHTWKPYYLYKEGLRRPYSEYIALFFENLLPILCSLLCTEWLLGHLQLEVGMADGWFSFFVNIFVFSIPFCVLSVLLSFVMSKNTRSFFKRFI